MRRIFGLVILMCLLVTFASCALTPPPAPTPEPETPAVQHPQAAQYYVLFDKDNHISIKLDIEDSELAKLQADFEHYSARGSKSPIYRMADLYIVITTPDGQKMEWTIPEVGVRMKGNTSRQDFYSDEEGMYNLIHFKVSFNETFDNPVYYDIDTKTWESKAKLEREARTFATLDKIDLRWNRNDDTTYIREGYAYDFYRSFDVLAPLSTLATLDIGDEHAGVFALYEPIDKAFLEKRLPTAALGGDLYKCGWSSEGATFTKFYSIGIENEDNSEFYIYDLKTNKTTSTHESLRKLIETLNKKGLTKEQFCSVVDEESFLYYCATSYIIGNPDDLRNNYNNTYIYFRPDTGKMVLIPYDMDRGFGVNVWNPYGDGMTTDSPYMAMNVGGYQRNPLFIASVQEGGFLVEEFTAVLREVMASKMLTDEAFNAAYERAYTLYKGDTMPTKSYHNAAWYAFIFDNTRTCAPSDGANMSFHDYIEAKLATLSAILRGEEVNGPSINVETPELYLRADFTGWDMDAQYRLIDKGDGLYAVTVTKWQEFRFKIYNQIDGRWYGAEVMDPDCAVRFEEDGHTNVVLGAGSYLIYFDVKTNSISIVQVN